MSPFDILRSLLGALDKSQRDIRQYTKEELDDVTGRLACKLMDLQLMLPANTPFEYGQNLQRALASMICEEVVRVEEAHRLAMELIARDQPAGVVLDFAPRSDATGDASQADGQGISHGLEDSHE
jgi:hypothetical protein